MTIRFQCECGKVLMASDDQTGLEGKCPACGKVTTVPQADTFDRKEPEESLATEELDEGGTAEEASMGIEGLKDLESEADDQPERKSWVRTPRFAMLASIIVVVLVALVVFMVVRKEKEAREELVVIKEIQPLEELEEEISAPPVGALLEEEIPQPTEVEPITSAIVEEESFDEVSTEAPLGEETESVPTEKEEEVVASTLEETPPAESMPPMGAYTINMASFRKKENADLYVEELKKMGIDAFDWEIDLPKKGRWYRVSVGGFPTRQEAENYSDELRQKGISQTFITKVPGAS